MVTDEIPIDTEERTLPMISAHDLSRETRRARLGGPHSGDLSLELYPLQIVLLARQHAAAHGHTDFAIATPFNYDDQHARTYLIETLQSGGITVAAEPFDRGDCQGLHISLSWPA